jgi:hypothetical protein
MRRILFPALGMVVVLVAYAGQELAAGAPSAARDAAQTASAVRLLVDETRVLKHTAVADDMLLASLRAVPRARRVVSRMKRLDASVERHADKLLADAHKAQAAQVTTEPAPVQALQSEARAMVTAGSEQTKLELQTIEQLQSTSTSSTTPTTVDEEAAMVADIRAQMDELAAVQQTTQSTIWGS